MNSERRHELQHNYLADHLGDLLKKIEPHAKLIAIAFAAIVGIVVAIGLYQNNASMARSDATLELIQNASGGDAEALASVGDRYSTTQAGELARLFEADTNLNAGITALYVDREEAESKINDALKAYREVASTSKDRLLVARSQFGVGHALESLGKVEDSVSAYRQVVAQADSDALAQAAQQRIDSLQKPETQEFLTWFAKQDFTPADPSSPPNLPSGIALPDLPDLVLPPVTADETIPDESDNAPEMSAPSNDVELAPASADPAPAEVAPVEPAADVENPTVRVTDEAE